jgi:hypothetical protein
MSQGQKIGTSLLILISLPFMKLFASISVITLLGIILAFIHRGEKRPRSSLGEEILSDSEHLFPAQGRCSGGSSSKLLSSSLSFL